MNNITYKPGQRPLSTEEQMRLRYGESYLNQPVAIVNKEPDLRDLVENFTEAAARVKDRATRYGMRSVLVDKETFNYRLSTCRECPLNLWDEDARLGLGRCRHEKCGCTKLKLWLASEKCPVNYWE